jgi:gliding motility-associated-like protein
LGLQKNASTAITAPGKNCTVWREDNTGYRFIPSSGASRYVISRLYTMTGTLIATADTVTTTPGLLDVSFPAVCFPAGSTDYEIRTTFSACDNPATQIISYDTITVNRSGTLNAFAITTNTDCGPPTGTITVTIPPGAGTPPYTYVLDGGAPVVGPSPYTFTNVSFGMHNVIITEGVSSCNSNLNVMVNRNNSLVATTSTTPTACAAVGTGSITITPTNGTAPFTFQLDGFLPVPGSVPFTFNNVFGGNHNVIVTDVTGCQTNVMVVNVPVNPGVTGIASSTLASCTEVANGTITATATSGIPPFTWQIDGGPVQNGPSPHTFTNVSSGLHAVTIIDNVGCSNTFGVNVSAGPGVNGNATSTPASCQGVNNGTITATATFGIAPFTWQLDGGPFQVGANPYTFTNISGGIHFLTIKDNVGCTRNINVTVSSGAGPTATVTSTATSCNGAANGTITVSPANGTAPYRFSLDGAPSVTGTIPYTFFNVNSGPHTIVVTDGPGCITGTIPINVATGPVITTTVSTTNVLCNGGASGTITVTQPALGDPPFQYSLDGVSWQNSNSFTGLIAGTYSVYYLSNNGCQGSQTVSVTQPAVLTATTSAIPVICNGESNGTISISPGGGVPPYQYSINGGTNWQSSSTFMVPAGTYTASIKDANNCTTTRLVTVNEPATLTAAAVNSNASCDGGNDGRITVIANGGNANYSYSTDGINFQSSNVFFVAPGDYNITVKDMLGCRTSFNTTVGLTVNLYLTPLTEKTICNGTSAQLYATSNATIYTWSPATGLNSTNIPNPVANPDTTTRYKVMVTLGRCTTEDSLLVKVNKEPVPDAGPDGDICYGQSYTLQGSGGSQYNWTPSIYLNTASGANPIATPTVTTTYTLSVIDSIGCKSLVTDQVKVVTSRPMRINTYPFDTTAHPGDQFQLLAASAGINYTWSPAGGLSNPNIANPVVTVGNNIGDEISYQVVGVTAEGCKGEGYVKIRVYKGPEIYVPTAFSPNNDGKNDLFTPYPVGIKSYKYFRVFNRWGQIIFSTTKQHEGWDGRIAGKDQATGVYVWMIEGITGDNKVITKKGTVTLIR